MTRNSTKELLSFLYNTRSSWSEVLSYLLLAKELNYIKENTCKELEERYNGLGKGINVFISKLKK